MKKLIFTLLLSSSFAFAVNPKKIDTEKILAREKMIKMNSNKKLVDDNCLTNYAANFYSFVNMGYSSNEAFGFATAIYYSCRGAHAGLASQSN